MLHLRVGVPPWVMCPQVGHGFQMHINVLELNTTLLALKSLVKTSHEHIKIMSDNTRVIHCINKMGTSHSVECHHQAIIHKNHLSAAHIPGKLNTVADKESRSNHVDTEWMLQPKVLNLALEHLSFKPEIDSYICCSLAHFFLETRNFYHPITTTLIFILF